jgi:hypothetical protein
MGGPPTLHSESAYAQRLLGRDQMNPPRHTPGPVCKSWQRTRACPLWLTTGHCAFDHPPLRRPRPSQLDPHCHALLKLRFSLRRALASHEKENATATDDETKSGSSAGRGSSKKVMVQGEAGGGCAPSVPRTSG